MQTIPNPERARFMERFLKIGAGALAFLALAALVATAIMVATSDRGGEVPQDVATPYPPATVTVADDYIPEDPDSEDTPVLTKEQIAEAKSVLNTDGRLAEVLSGESFTVTNIGPWEDSERLIGALVKIELDNPVSYTGSLPAVGFPADGRGYHRGEVSARADGIESLEMLVDLDRRIVAEIRIDKATGEVHLEYGNPRWFISPSRLWTD